MKVEVSREAMARARAVAKEVEQMMIPSYRFDGRALEAMPPVTIRDAIIGKLVDPGELVRLQLVYPEGGPDDRWYAACEMLLGGGLQRDGRTYRILGSSNSIKKGVVWLATDAVREQLHPYFSNAQEALSYLGTFFSGCTHGIHHLDDLHGYVVEDGVHDTADGMGRINFAMLERLGLPKRQIQVRLISGVSGQEWLAKGTLLPGDLPDDVDVVLPASMIKGAGQPPAGSWRCWFGVRDVAQARPYASSFSFAQWFDDTTLEAVWPVAEERLAIIQGALSDRDRALRFLGLIQGDGSFREARMKAEAFLQAGIAPDHPWLHRQLVQLMRRAYVQLALGGGIELTGRMGAWADLPEGVVCIQDEPAGPLVLSRYPIRDPHSLQAVWNEPGAIPDALPGTVYVNATDVKLLDGDFDGDYYITCSQAAVVDAVSSPNWYPGYHRKDVPPKTRRNDPLDALPYVAVQAMGGVIGTLTYAISGALHLGQLAKVADLSAALQSAVMGIKWDVQVDRALLNDPTLSIPDYISQAKTDKDLFVRHAEPVEGDFPLIRNYNRVVDAWKRDAHTTRPLVHFKAHVPLWAEPGALDHVEEVHAVVQVYNRWIADILAKVEDPTHDDLTGPLDFLRAWDASKQTDRHAWAVALWHVVHGSRADSTGSAAFNAFSEETAALIAQHSGVDQAVRMPAPSRTRPDLVAEVIPLVGGVSASEEAGLSFYTALQQLPDVVSIDTRQNGGANAAFWSGDLYLGQVPKDHPLYTAIPIDQRFDARLQLRGRTLYLLLKA